MTGTKNRFVYLPLVLLCTVLAGNLFSADVIDIIERDKSGKQHTIDFDSYRFPIVDINATLEITIDKNEVKKRAALQYEYSSPVDLELLGRVTSVLEQQNIMLTALDTENESVYKSVPLLQLYSRNMIEMMDMAMQIPRLRVNVITLMEKELEQTEELNKLFVLIADEIEIINNQLDVFLAEEYIQFSLAGWLGEKSGSQRAIHIPGFDDYSEGKFYEKPHFVLPVTEEATKQFEHAKNVSDAYNTTGVHPSRKAVENLYQSLANEVDKTLHCVAGLFNKDTLKQVFVEDNPQVSALSDTLNSIRDQALTLKSDVERLVTLAKQMGESSTGLYEGQKIVVEGVKLVDGLKEKIPQLIATANEGLRILESDELKESLEDNVKTMISKVENCAGDLKNLSEANYTALKDRIQLVFGNAGKSMARANLKLGDKVKRFLIDDIPVTTSIDLHKLGKRDNGDAVHFRAYLAKASEDPTFLEPEVNIEQKTLLMYQTGVFVNYTVGAIFIDPKDGDDISLERRFQMAPSYSILVRYGKRSHSSFYRILNPGIGINLSASDFNQNSSPELGLGLVVSVVKDIFQAGIGTNVRGDNNANYWFFGVQIPFDMLLKQDAKSN